MKLDDLVDDLCRFLMSHDTSPPFIFGISGGQGAGKSTLCAALAKTLETKGKNALILSLDDFYLSKAAREHLAQTVHPLCATRGVPGTHNVDLLAQVLNSLAQASPEKPLHLPRFSKSHDDMLPEEQNTRMSVCPDLVFLEGWCVGGRAACIEARPQNSWEETHDPQSIWKQWS
ncbi:MAG: P-loop NTPase fold protein, partial [Pseudomonadota bacterium]|nr:P-loop NTPase fold protein [Pseudomonadota bacterium]